MKPILGYTSAPVLVEPLRPDGPVTTAGGPAVGRATSVAGATHRPAPLRIDGELTVVAAAVRRDGVVYSLPPPARHHDVIWEICAKCGLSGYQPRVDDQGFLLSDGRYAMRRAAAHVALRSGQVTTVAHPSHGLFSEDLW